MFGLPFIGPIAEAIVSFAKSPLGRWIGVALAVLALLAGVHHHGVTQGRAGERVKADREIAAVNARLTTCHGNVERLDGALRTQGAAVTALKAESDRRTAAAAKALQTARTATEAANRRAGAILAAKPGADQCASAEALIMEHVR